MSTTVSSMPPSSGGEEPGHVRRRRIATALQRLHFIGRRLQLLSLISVMCLAGSLLTVAMAAAARSPNYRETLVPVYRWIDISFLPILCGICSLFLWEALRREGMVIYEEISDELEWRHRRSRQANSAPEAKPQDAPESSDEKENTFIETAAGVLMKAVQRTRRPNLEVRIALRRFLNHADLPFIPGGMAAGYYAGLFFILFLVDIALLVWGPH